MAKKLETVLRKQPKPKRPSIGLSRQSTPKNQNRRKHWKKYRGQGR